MNPKPYLTLDEVADVLTDRAYFNDKLIRHIGKVLGKWLRVDQVEDYISEVTYRTLKRAATKPEMFTSRSAVQAYVCQGCWWAYRDAHVSQAKYRANQIVDTRDFMLEGSQYATPSSQEKTLFKSLDELTVEPVAHEEAELSATDFRDRDITRMYEIVFTWLDDSVADGEFTFQEVSLYKVYILNRWSVRKVAEDSGFSLSTCNNAISKVKRAMKTIDWQIKKRMNQED